MREIRIYYPDLNTQQTTITLEEQAHCHLSRVLRLKKGMPVNLFNGNGLLAQTTITDIERKKTLLEIKNITTIDNQSPLKLTLAQALTRNDKMDLIIQKATELGVNTIAPIITEYCQLKLSPERIQNRLHHWQKIIESAAAQSERSHLPLLLTPMPLATWLEQNTQTLITLAARNNNRHTLPETLTEAAIIVGPEGGFSDNDLALLNLHQANYYLLGPRILRTETAGLAMISILQSRFGDFNC